MRYAGPALTLYFLAPALAELLSGSAPPAEFFHPFGFVVITLSYGCGALLIREISLQFPQRWHAIFVFGIAYAIAEEALTAKSFFDPHWGDLGVLATYGRWGETAWIWVWAMIAYHTVYSIALPTYITEFIYAEHRGERWLTPRGLKSAGGLFLAVVLFGYLAFGGRGKPFHPGPLQTLGSVAMITGLISYAWRRCAQPSAPHGVRSKLDPAPSGETRETLPGPWKFGVIGFLYMPVLLALPSFFYARHLPAPLTFILYVLVTLLMANLVYRWSGAGALWTERHRFALLTGLYLPLIVLAPIQELDNAKRPDDTSGMAMVGGSR
ncbi:MAG: hypothetical protein V2G42_09330 [bacterium JZ-2024 1]